MKQKRTKAKGVKREAEKEKGSGATKKLKREDPVEDDFSNLEHFSVDHTNSIERQLNDPSIWRTQGQTLPLLGKIQASIPNLPSNSHQSLDACINFTEMKGICANLEECFSEEEPSNLQKEILGILRTYKDFYFGEASHEKWDQIRFCYSFHAVNHVMMSQSLINQNSKIESQESSNHKQIRDQGFTRPRVLILVPFKNSAYKVIKALTKIAKGKAENSEIYNEERFEEEYGWSEEEKWTKNDPEDFQKLFEGDIKEDFMMGIKIQKKGVKLYTKFYSSDIIVASPLALKIKIGTPGEESYDPEFVSSIEVLIVDQADVFLMQNWMHLVDITQEMNKIPTTVKKITTSVHRVRPWCANGLARFYRQTILFSSVHTALGRSYLLKCLNYAGRYEVVNPTLTGSIDDVKVGCELSLTKVPNGSDSSSTEARYTFFIKNVLKQLQKEQKSGILLYVPDYCDYLRIVLHLKNDGGMSASTINEYMIEEPSKIAKAKSEFFCQRRKMLIVTGRYHFYKRSRIKGVRHIVFYQLPEHWHFVPEVCNWMIEANQNPKLQNTDTPTVNVIFSGDVDYFRLMGVFGSKKASEMVSSDKTVHRCPLNIH